MNIEVEHGYDVEYYADYHDELIKPFKTDLKHNIKPSEIINILEKAWPYRNSDYGAKQTISIVIRNILVKLIR